VGLLFFLKIPSPLLKGPKLVLLRITVDGYDVESEKRTPDAFLFDILKESDDVITQNNLFD
jgi:hypothetical protein